MATKLHLSAEQINIIVEHNTNMLLAAEHAVIKLRQIPNDLQPEHVKGQIKYWINVGAGLRWANSVARQRLAKDCENGDATV